MISLQQIDSLRTVAREPHGIGPVPLKSPIFIHGDKTVRGPNGIPEFVAFGAITGAIFGVPPESIPCCIERDGIL